MPIEWAGDSTLYMLIEKKMNQCTNFFSPKGSNVKKFQETDTKLKETQKVDSITLRSILTKSGSTC